MIAGPGMRSDFGSCGNHGLHGACTEGTCSPTTGCRTRRLQYLAPLLVHNLQRARAQWGSTSTELSGHERLLGTTACRRETGDSAECSPGSRADEKTPKMEHRTQGGGKVAGSAGRCRWRRTYAPGRINVPCGAVDARHADRAGSLVRAVPDRPLLVALIDDRWSGHAIGLRLVRQPRPARRVHRGHMLPDDGLQDTQATVPRSAAGAQPAASSRAVGVDQHRAFWA